MENQKDLKWICLVSLGAMFILLFNYNYARDHYWQFPGFLGAWSYGWIVAYFFLNVLSISTATLYMSGIRGVTVYRITIGSFVV